MYSTEITIPPNTPVNAPAEVTLFLGREWLTRVIILFPLGCYNVVGIRLLEEGRQFEPVGGGWFYGDNRAIEFNSYRRMSDLKRLTIQGYSLAEDWPHRIIVMVEDG